jgi:GNAT superfamily N-acetyltransferase
MSSLRVVVEPHASESLKQWVRDHLDTYNVAVTGHAEYHSVSIFLRDEHDEILGGLLGNMWGGWLHVGFLWVTEALRGQGHGSTLLETAERLARERGCQAVWLTTFSFQAPAFYPKFGYEVFATLDDHPSGHRHFFLKKRLVPA